MSQKYKLKQVSAKDVRFSRENPRGESPEEIRNDKTFEQLKDSVAQFGVLVPIVVHERGGSGGKTYMLIDGERRLRAALATGTEAVPAHIASPDDRLGELVQAFHIHMLRKQWKQVAKARALKRMKAELRRRGVSKTDEDFLEDLQAQTGCTNVQLKSLERAIKYADATLKEVDEGKIAWSHLVQFEASFVEQLEQHYSGLLKKLGVERVRKVLVSKARKKILSSTRALIESVLPVVARAKTKEERKFAEELLKKFIDRESMTAEEIKKQYERRYPPSEDFVGLADNILDSCNYLNAMLGQVDVGQMITFHSKAKELEGVLGELRTEISRKLGQFRRYLK